MVAIPPAIMFVNDDLSPSVHDTLVRQLFINQILDGYTFDSFIAADPSWPDKIKQLNQRVMVVRTFADRFSVTTWNIPDVIIFIKNGLASVEINKGPPSFTVPVLKLDWGYLLNIHLPPQWWIRHREREACEANNLNKSRVTLRQFEPGHHFDGMTHQYHHRIVFKPGQKL